MTCETNRSDLCVQRGRSSVHCVPWTIGPAGRAQLERFHHCPVLPFVDELTKR